jgi:hypothetical protein
MYLKIDVYCVLYVLYSDDDDSHWQNP